MYIFKELSSLPAIYNIFRPSGDQASSVIYIGSSVVSSGCNSLAMLPSELKTDNDMDSSFVLQYAARNCFPSGDHANFVRFIHANGALHAKSAICLIVTGS